MKVKVYKYSMADRLWVLQLEQDLTRLQLEQDLTRQQFNEMRPFPSQPCIYYKFDVIDETGHCVNTIFCYGPFDYFMDTKLKQHETNTSAH